MAKLIRVRHESVSVTSDVLSHQVPSARMPEIHRSQTPNDVTQKPAAQKPAPEKSGTEKSGAGRPEDMRPFPRKPASGVETISAGKPIRLRHSARHARHARTSDARGGRRPLLSIRCAEARRWSADLSGPGAAGLVVYGMGGIGKSTLAVQIAARVSRLKSDLVSSVMEGEISAASFMAQPAETDFIIFNNFDDNLSQRSGQSTVRDPALAALLANWTGKLLITCREPFALDVPAGRIRLAFRQLGPLTKSGAAELTTSLAALRQLGESDRDRVWRLTAGHPLAMEYLNAQLAMGERYQDVARRIEAMVEARTGQPLPKTEPTELSEATAEMIASAATDQMFGDLYDRLSAGARSLLVRASVFRVPVGAEVLGARPGQIAECEAAGLLTIGPGHDLSVHRWTADELHRRLAEADLGGQVVAAHRRAAGFWRPRVASSPAGQRAELEASYHQRVAAQAREAEPQAAELSQQAGGRRRRVVRLSVVAAFAAMSIVLAVGAAQDFSAPHLAASDVATQTVSGVPVTQASAVRNHAAAWVAGQVSGGAIIACDPAMCSALVRSGIPAGNLLVLSPGAADPLGSSVVLATAAVRSMFGSRLTSVYAPEVLASFGAGQARIEVRVVAPDGAAAYRTALAADLQARQAAGSQLLVDSRITVTPSARAQLAAGQVDTRLLITLATLAASQPVQIKAFGDAGPGASPGMPLRAVELITSNATAPNVLAFFRAQRAPYLSAQAGLTQAAGGGSVLTVEFAAPGPLGLMQDQSLPS
jgi:hypothetical protein